MKELLVYLQLENENIEDFSLDLITGAKEISDDMKISGVVILPFGVEFKNKNYEKFGLDKLYILKSGLKSFDKRLHPYLITELVKKINPEIFILNSTTEGREIAPLVASSIQTGLTADCTKLEIEDDKLISTRPTFGGKLMASILCKNKPQMATVRTNIFKKKIFENKELEIEEFDFDIKPPEIEILDFIQDNKNFFNLQNAKIILAGGMGLKNKENFDKLKLLADKIGAKVGGTRKAVEKGFIEKKFQIGQTGSVVAPEIYVAFGISGAIHHISGMENSKKIISINTDKNAPIFKYSDIGIIMDAACALDIFLEEIKKGGS